METIKRRMTKQRAVIYDYVRSHHTHPTAAEVHTGLLQEYPEMSLATVYRNLNLLVETGLVNKITMPSAPDRFDGDLHSHYHFLCKMCGDVKDVDIPSALQFEIDQSVQTSIGHRVDDHEVYFKGVCSACLKKAKG